MFQNILHAKWFIITLIFLITAVTYYCFTVTPKEEVTSTFTDEPPIIEKNITKPEEDYIYVDIKGAIAKPGVYRIPNHSRINDIINASGGLTKNADTSLTNLAFPLTDGLAITIYTKSEVKKKLLNQNNIKMSPCPSTANQECVTSNETTIVTPKDNSTESLISINTATLEQLDTLSGIGPALAQRIIDYRDTIGQFNNLEELKNVSGIGETLFAKIKDHLTL